jgi:hypothetical protein
MKVEITQQDGQLVTDQRKDGGLSYSQRAYLHTGAAFPMPFKLPLNGPNAYQAGHYQLDPSCFKVSQYGGLEIDRYGIKLIQQSNVKAA